MLTYERQVTVRFVLSADKLYIETVLKYCVCDWNPYHVMIKALTYVQMYGLWSLTVDYLVVLIWFLTFLSFALFNLIEKNME